MIGSNKDGNASLSRHHVCLCRSGIQYYSYNDVVRFFGKEPPYKKEWYREMRPAHVVVEAKKLCDSLPICREHPDVWVDKTNFSTLAGGVTGEHVDVERLADEAEIGLYSTLNFFTETLQDYYDNGNVEVSLGYNCEKHFVDNPEEVGYDIILDKITEVNHLALTQRGRGGEHVAVLDSAVAQKSQRSFKMKKTNLFAFLKHGKKNEDSASSFGQKVVDEVTKVKDSAKEDVEKAMKGVIDSLDGFKDGEDAQLLCNMVADCFDSIEETLANKDSLVSVLDKAYTKVVDSMSDVEQFFQNDAEPKDDDKGVDETPKDGCAKDAEPDGEGDEEPSKDEKETKNTDSYVTKDELKSVIAEAVAEAVDSRLGLNNNSDSLKGGSVDDSIDDSALLTLSDEDYAQALGL